MVVSPGSRSTALVVALSQVADLEWSMHLDERSAGFAALGHAKATGCAVGLICTSGTAAANYLPAVSEASLSQVPLVVMTADRPPEHQDWGVGQAFDQTGLFHRQVVAELQMPVGADGGLDHAVRAGWRATWTALDLHGPVHVNWPFRLPLEPTGPLPPAPTLTGSAPRRPVASDTDVERLVSTVSSHPRGVIVAGPGAVSTQRPEDARNVLDFAAHVGWPVLADALSGLRGHDGPMVEAADQVVAATPDAADLVLHLGDTPTAKSIRLWWERLPGAEHVLIDPTSRWNDPSHTFTDRYAVDVASLLSEALPRVTATTSQSGWIEGWTDRGRRARGALDATIDDEPAWTEIHVSRSLSSALRDDDVLVTSSSLPVRDIDSFSTVASSFEVIANRGINGIDGVVAPSIGVARALMGRRVVVHLGDIALLHDIGSLLDATRQGIDLSIVVANNDGGGIFSFLPIREALDPAEYRRLFHTPHGTTFEFLEAVEGTTHTTVRSTGELHAELEAARRRPGVTVLEAIVDTDQRMDLQARLAAAVASVIG